MTIYQVMTGKSRTEVESDFASARGYGDLKSGVAEVVISGLRPIQERTAALIEDSATLDRVLARTGTDRLLVSESDILDGIAWSVA